MKKLKIYLVGQKFELELEDDFYDYIKDDLLNINNSTTQIKDLLNLVLSLKYKIYKNEQKMTNLLKKLEN